MPLDLGPITKFAEGEMTDTVRVERGAAEGEDEWDPFNIIYVPASNTIVYPSGKGLVTPINAYATEQPEGEGIGSYVRYDMLLPLSCPPLVKNDFVILEVCFRDAQLNGTLFTVESTDRSSMQAVRRAQLVSREFSGPIV